MSWRRNDCLENCRRCPRLVAFREGLPKRASYQDQDYWRKPVYGFGDPEAKLLIVGLAPSAHGGNRTGRIFTGDESAKFLFDCLHSLGLANQKISLALQDNLKLKGCYLTAIVRCVPPENRPTAKEKQNCTHFWQNELKSLPQITSVLALGKLAFDEIVKYAKTKGHDTKGLKFGHGVTTHFEGLFTLCGSYHPSPQNTYTKKLTKETFVENIIKNRLIES